MIIAAIVDGGGVVVVHGGGYPRSRPADGGQGLACRSRAFRLPAGEEAMVPEVGQRGGVVGDGAVGCRDDVLGCVGSHGDDAVIAGVVAHGAVVVTLDEVVFRLVGGAEGEVVAKPASHCLPQVDDSGVAAARGIDRHAQGVIAFLDAAHGGGGGGGEGGHVDPPVVFAVVLRPCDADLSQVSISVGIARCTVEVFGQARCSRHGDGSRCRVGV